MKKLIVFVLSLTTIALGGDMVFPSDLTLEGQFKDRIDLTLKRLNGQPYDLDLLVQDVARIPKNNRRFEDYQGDVSGRTLGAWSYISRLTHSHPEKLDLLFNEILQYQNDAGYFGKNQQLDGWDQWGRQLFGHGRLLAGLVQYYRLTESETALSAAKRLGDYLIDTVPEWTSIPNNPWTNTRRTVDWSNPTENRQHFIKTHITSILESLMMLYEVTNDSRLLDAGKSIVTYLPSFGVYHSHSYLGTMVGMAMLYDHTGDEEIFDQLTNVYWQQVMRHGRPMDGGAREWFPDDHRTEGCSITDWIRVNMYLWKVTKNAVYLDEAENAWLNALYFHQTANGAFGHAHCTPTGYAARYSESWWCCTQHGLWAMAELANFITVQQDDQLYFNFYTPARFELNGFGNIEIDTDYPQTGNIEISAAVAQKTKVTVHFRLPDWATDAQISINGKAVEYEKADGYAVFQHTWTTGDKIQLEFDIPLRLLDANGNNILNRRMVNEPQPGYFYYGPLLLASHSSGRRGFADLVFFDADKDYRQASGAKPLSFPRAHFSLPAQFDGMISTVNLLPMAEAAASGQWTEEWKHFKRNSEKPIERKPIQLLHTIELR